MKRQRRFVWPLLGVPLGLMTHVVGVAAETPVVVTFICDIAKLDGSGEARGVEYLVDHTRHRLDGEPAEITRSGIVSRKKLSNGELLVTRIEAANGNFSLASSSRGTISVGHCVVGPPPELAATVGAPQAPPAVAAQAPPPRQPTNYELEAAAFASASAEFQKLVAQGLNDREIQTAFDTYWQRRLDLADRLDRGQISPEAGAQLKEAYRQQFTAVVERRKQEVQAQMAQSLAQQRAQADARRMEESAQMINFGLRMLAPQTPPPSAPVTCRWVGPNWVCL